MIRRKLWEKLALGWLASGRVVFLVEIETQGNQRHVFASNRRREVHGATEQILRMTTERLIGLVAELQGSPVPVFGNEGYSNAVAAWLINDAANPPIESSDRLFEVIIAASGKAVLLARDRSAAETLITELSLTVQHECPGLSLMGAISPEPFELTTSQALHAERKAVLDRLTQHTGTIFPPLDRFARLPFSDECRSTGGPAAGFDDKDPPWRKEGRLYPYSAESLAKRAFIDRARARLTSDYQDTLYLQTDIVTDTHEDLDWWAVVHADGNGLGQLFLQFDKCVPGGRDASARSYINSLRRFSIALERETRDAAVDAVRIAWRKEDTDTEYADLKPLVLAGDDLTVVCDGRYAVDFAHAFLKKFRERTGTCPDLTEITERAVELEILKDAALTAAAGVAVVKPHHPFHRAYELAEDLCKSAKECKKLPFAASALDFYVAFDMASDLDHIRDDLSRHGGPNWAGPYLVGTEVPVPEAGPVLRPFNMLEDGVEAVVQLSNPQNDDDKVIGRGALHDLRTALFSDPDAAELAVIRLQHRPGFDKLRDTLFGGNALRDPKFGDSTLLLDAMDLAAIRPTELSV